MIVQGHPSKKKKRQDSNLSVLTLNSVLFTHSYIFKKISKLTNAGLTPHYLPCMLIGAQIDTKKKWVKILRFTIVIEVMDIMDLWKPKDNVRHHVNLHQRH